MGAAPKGLCTQAGACEPCGAGCTGKAPVSPVARAAQGRRRAGAHRQGAQVGAGRGSSCCALFLAFVHGQWVVPLLAQAVRGAGRHRAQQQRAPRQRLAHLALDQRPHLRGHSTRARSAAEQLNGGHAQAGGAAASSHREPQREQQRPRQEAQQQEQELQYLLCALVVGILVPRRQYLWQRVQYPPAAHACSRHHSTRQTARTCPSGCGAAPPDPGKSRASSCTWRAALQQAGG